MTDGERLADAASALIGSPYRLHGRDPRFGLDCVGLIFASLAAIGERPRFPNQYGLRNTLIAEFLPFARASGLVEADGRAIRGDVLLVKPGPGQHHLIIADTRQSFIHAHAGLRRVVRMPGPLPWPIERSWRLQKTD